MQKKEEELKDNVELSEQQITLVKLATLSMGLSKLFTALATETDLKMINSMIEKVNETMERIDNIILEELLELDLTKTRD
jgi:hypothetical protein